MMVVDAAMMSAEFDLEKTREKENVLKINSNNCFVYSERPEIPEAQTP